jgi:phage-related protein
MTVFLKQMTGFYEYTKGIHQNMTGFLKYMTGFYEYAEGIYRNMTAFLKYMTGFHKFYCTVPAAVRHIPQTALTTHIQSLREEPFSPSRLYKITMTTFCYDN